MPIDRTKNPCYYKPIRLGPQCTPLSQGYSIKENLILNNQDKPLFFLYPIKYIQIKREREDLFSVMAY